jgi:hypothetical protein
VSARPPEFSDDRLHRFLQAREFMMRLEDDLSRRKEKEQALLKQRILMEGQPIIAPPGKATWRN